MSPTKKQQDRLPDQPAFVRTVAAKLERDPFVIVSRCRLSALAVIGVDMLLAD